MYFKILNTNKYTPNKNRDKNELPQTAAFHMVHKILVKTYDFHYDLVPFINATITNL